MHAAEMPERGNTGHGNEWRRKSRAHFMCSGPGTAPAALASKANIVLDTHGECDSTMAFQCFSMLLNAFHVFSRQSWAWRKKAAAGAEAGGQGLLRARHPYGMLSGEGSK